MNNYKYFSYATYVHTKSNQYDNAVKEAYGYRVLTTDNLYIEMNYIYLDDYLHLVLI
jgi:hypothetical protein